MKYFKPQVTRSEYDRLMQQVYPNGVLSYEIKKGYADSVESGGEFPVPYKFTCICPEKEHKQPRKKREVVG